MERPFVLGVLVAPAETFREVAVRRRGFGVLFGLLAIELLLAQPVGVAGHLARFGYDVGGGIVGLISVYRDFVLKPAIVSFAVGIAIYYALRRRGVVLDPWTGASFVAYAWVPHTLLVAASLLLAAAGLDHSLLPHRPTAQAEGPWVLAKLAIAFAPTAAFVALAWRAVLRPGPAAPPPAPRWRPWAAGSVACLLLGGALALHAQRLVSSWDEVRPAMPDDALPAFVLRGIDGGRLTDQEVRGSVLLVDFWATWCGPCVAAMPHLEKLHQELAPKGLRLVSVNTEPDDVDSVRAFAREHKLTFPVWIDSGALQYRLKVQTYPTMLLVDAAGVIRHIHVGSTSMVTLREEAEALLRTR